MVIFILNLLIALILLLVTLGADSEGYKRGTNSAARFVRDTAADMVYVTVCAVATAFTVVTVLLLMIFKCHLYYCLPCLVMMFLPLVFKSISNRNEQRVTDARVVTKGTLQVVDATGEAVGAVGGAAVAVHCGIDPATGAKVGKVAGKSVGAIAGKAADQMTDVDVSLLNANDKQALREQIHHVDSVAIEDKSTNTITDEKFKSYCERIGISTANGLDVAATEVLTYLPEVYTKDDASNSDLDRAKKALSKMWGG